MYPVYPPSAAVARVEVSQPGQSGGAVSFGHAAAIVVSLVVLLGLAAAFGATTRASRGRERRSFGQDSGRDLATPGVGPAGPAGPAPSGGDRRSLVSALMVVIDTAPDSPAGARALRTLKQVGVETIEPKHGAAFDSRLHCVCGVVDAPDPQLVDSVAAVVRPGYVDHGLVLREADVQIYGSTREKTHAVPVVS